MNERTDLVRGYREAYRRAAEEKKKQQCDLVLYTKNDQLKRDLEKTRPLRGWLSVDLPQ